MHVCQSIQILIRLSKLSGLSRDNFPVIRLNFTSAIAGGSAMAVNSVRVAAAQMTSINDLSSNFALCSRLVNEAVSAGAKMLCLPEVFSFMPAKDGESLEIAEPLDGPIMNRYCSLARESSIWLSLGGFQEKGPDDEHFYNTHVIIDDAGTIRSTYRKIHLFDVDVPGGRVYKESSYTKAGEDVVAVDSPIGRLGLTVCYDLRFPELYQQLRFQHDAQVLLVPSAFTKVTGEAHWEILLRSRAIETQCYVIAAAQAGKSNEKRESYGDTLIIDPWGKVVGRLPDRLTTGITVADIDFDLIESVRGKIPIAKALPSLSGKGLHSNGSPLTSGNPRLYDLTPTISLALIHPDMKKLGGKCTIPKVKLPTSKQS